MKVRSRQEILPFRAVSFDFPANDTVCFASLLSLVSQTHRNTYNTVAASVAAAIQRDVMDDLSQVMSRNRHSYYDVIALHYDVLSRTLTDE